MDEMPKDPRTSMRLQSHSGLEDSGFPRRAIAFRCCQSTPRIQRGFPECFLDRALPQKTMTFELDTVPGGFRESRSIRWPWD